MQTGLLWQPYDFNEGKSRILRVPNIRDLETLVGLSNDIFPFLDVTNLQLRFPGENEETASPAPAGNITSMYRPVQTLISGSRAMTLVVAVCAT
ncbi:hypothetical protein N7501_009704 [Penicillium viridicatum]|nr:hypothetical protein N7501_009704 [Penicillium viridicatum]